MGGDEAVSAPVAGVGFRHGTDAAEIVALVRRALAEAGLGGPSALATAADRAALPAFAAAAAALGVPGRGIGPNDLAAVDVHVRTRSTRIEALRGIGSLAEAAALAAAGPGARLVLRRIASPGATCALAMAR
jgi:cobalt-precorrin 5A hydrolase